MSDTCWLNIEFRKEDLPKFNEVLEYENEFWDEAQLDEEEIRATVYEANYGWYNEIQDLAKAGLTFTVSHGAGGEYGPCVYACYKGDLAGCSADWGGTPVVPVAKEGVDEGYLEECMRYYRILKRVEADENVRKKGNENV